ncbi:glycosyltransferase family 25 protein [Martelella lutilitoris]|uniref:Glycosyltransferase family 25 protein n=1 Tax=Martelella lutilitoris TaxID=2583532 RepID=A0A5C4JP24_9HYPH|nr:glycosyltransferase family 25 protein [Martelella lutilitoris]TNB46961.1 glycosyltransferase family 25 protein [Martelella lutilitoris]
MLTFVINLDRDTDRLAAIEEIMAARGLDFTRLAASDARLLGDDEVARLSAFPAPFSREMTRGEIGCYLSHRRAWSALVESGAPAAAVFEDDVEISASTRAVLDGLASRLPAGVDIVKIETSMKPAELARKTEVMLGAHALKRLVGCHIGSAGYVITRQGAEKMLARSQTLFVPVDAALFDPRAGIRNDLSVMQVVPALCVQNRYVAGGAGAEDVATSIEERGKRKSYGRSAAEIALNRTRDRIAVIARKISAVIARRRAAIVEYRP